MKANMALPVITLLLCLIIGNSSVSLAGDSGEERTIPVIEWGCWSCNKRVFTFTPDSLDGKIIQHKDPNYQQSKWIILKTRSPIKKCEKMFDGAHIFDKKREFMTSGYTIMTQADSFVVIKGGWLSRHRSTRFNVWGANKVPMPLQVTIWTNGGGYP